ncbi:putative transmembrane protein [Cinnamomum micranthum f. kanehirae]|uniref:Putative transmembrane protein n=1 Tax=Cinnamomum micranthum f. kanehirae TaxID=337451 RepID=A0A3S3PB75_9MAGN|nr:putative transmembrane protein [Cinnamomum micranthum f. kanehirae]
MEVPKSSPKVFYLMTLSLILPLSLVILVHSYIIHSLADNFHFYPSSTIQSQLHYFALILFFYALYLLLVSIFFLITTSASIFTVASCYTSNPITFSSTFHAIPRIFPRLFVTFLWISLLTIIYSAVVFICALVTIAALSGSLRIVVYIVIIISICSIFIWVHLYVTSMWQLASVVSVLEPVYGLGAIKKSHALLQGKRLDATILVLGYLLLCALISFVFDVVVVHGGELGIAVYWRIVVGVVLVGLMVGLNVVGLMVQNVFYYVCKSFHHESIDKNALLYLLGWYVKVQVKLNSMI